MPRWSQTLEDRFWSKVDVRGDDECWPWLASKQQSSGYGQFMLDGRPQLAHRVAFLLTYGYLPPPPIQLDHVRARGCTRRDCVNPAHLEPVTNRENARRGDCGIHNAQRTHCRRGHPLSGDNVRIETTGSRRCLECKRIYGREWRARQKVA